MATSYANAGGTGNRTASITVTASGFVGTPSTLVNGVTTPPEGWFTAGMTAPVQFDFATAKVIDEAKFYQDLSTTHGTWKWQGSPDASSWTDIGGSFTLGGTSTQTITTLAGNTTGYRYYRIANVSGTASSASYALEFEFKIDTVTVGGGTEHAYTFIGMP
jgi:hypothetical protein